MNTNRQRLIAALRTELPPGFEWNFGTILEKDTSCGSLGCALGLATILFPHSLVDEYSVDEYSKGLSEKDPRMSVHDDENVAEFFGLHYTSNDELENIVDIFYTPSIYGVDSYEDVTPAMVADKLEEAE